METLALAFGWFVAGGVTAAVVVAWMWRETRNVLRARRRRRRMREKALPVPKPGRTRWTSTHRRIELVVDRGVA